MASLRRSCSKEGKTENLDWVGPYQGPTQDVQS
jgi:hypothetical protein